jgi:hypothetical protein
MNSIQESNHKKHAIINNLSQSYDFPKIKQISVSLPPVQNGFGLLKT